MSTLSLVVNAKDRSSQTIAAVEQKVASLQDKIESVSARMKSLGDGLQSVGTKMSAAITAPIVGIGFAALKAAADQEQLQIAFTTMLGSADKAKTMLDELARFSAETPFEMPQVQAAAKQLLAFGISAEDIEPTLRQLGDVAAGVGAPIGDLAYLFGTASASGRIMTADINQFAARGIPIIDSLATVLGVATSEVRDMAAEGKITADHMKQAFAVMTSEGSRFGGMMVAQSASLLGMWSTLKDNLTITLQQVGTELIKALDLNTVVGNALTKVNELRTKLVEFIQVNPELTKMGLLFAGIAAALGPLLVTLGFVVTQVSALGPVFAALTGPIGLVILAVGALATAFATDFMGIRTITMDVVGAIQNLLEVIADAGPLSIEASEALSLFPAALQPIVGWALAAYGGMQNFIEVVKDAGINSIEANEAIGLLPTGLQQLVTGVSNAWTVIGPTIDNFKSAFTQFTESFSSAFSSDSAFSSEMFQKLQNVFTNLQSTLTTLQPTLIGIGAVLGVVVVGAFNTLAAAIGNIVDISLPLINQILSTLELLSGALSGVAQVAVGVSTGDWTLAWSGMKTIFESFYTYFSTTAENIKTLMSAIVTFASEALVGTLEAFGVDTSGVVATTESLVAFIKNFTWPDWPVAPEFVLKLIDWVFPEVPQIISTLVKWAFPTVPSVIKDMIDWEWPGMPEWIDTLFNWSWPSLPALPSWLGGSGQAIGTGFLQRGGPTLVGEDGPEMVTLPRGVEVVNNRDLRRMSRNGDIGGGIQVGSINVYSQTGNPVELANQVIQEINRRQRR